MSEPLDNLELERFLTAVRSYSEDPPKSLSDWERAVIEFVRTMGGRVFKAKYSLLLFGDESKDRLIDLAREMQSKDRVTIEALFWIAFYEACHFKEGLYLKGSFDAGDIEIQALWDKVSDLSLGEYGMRANYVDFKLTRNIVEAELKKLRADAITAVSELRDAAEAQVKDRIRGIEEAVEKISGWDADLSGWQEKADALGKFYKNQLEKINFAGLSNAFSEMIRDKEKEKRVQVAYLSFLSFLLLLIPACYAYMTWGEIFNISLAWHAIPLIAAEGLLLYFFRIFLASYYSAKAQILQLSLRHNLCAFIESYGDFAARVRRDKDDRTLEKFEAVVFSGIVAGPDQVPSTFDGLDKLIEIAKAVRGSGKH